jgi:peptidoglycan hydrolase-like protein with peptidoglycan-binding domain
VSVLDALLEGFVAGEARNFRGEWEGLKAGDKVYAKRNHSTAEPGSVLKGRSLTVKSNKSGVLAATDDVSGLVHTYTKPSLEALSTKPTAEPRRQATSEKDLDRARAIRLGASLVKGDKVHTVDGAKRINGVLTDAPKGRAVITSKGVDNSNMVNVKWEDGDTTLEHPKDLEAGHHVLGGKVTEEQRERVGVGVLLEHFHETLTPLVVAKPKQSGKPKSVPHKHLHGLTDAALRSRLKSDSGSSPSERQAAAALIQARRDASEKHAAKPAADAKDEEPAPAREGLELVLEGFATAAPAKMGPSAPAPNSAAAQPENVGSWNASKHPRQVGGKFGYTTGGKRATKASTSNPRTLEVGSKGTLVSSIQRQLGIPASGAYDENTRAAVTRYQQVHHLQVDGVIGRQTLAALRGNPNPQSIAPGPITAAQATVKKPKQPKDANAKANFAGGVVV